MVKLHKHEIEKNHAALMAAASEAMRKNGIAATSVAEVAQSVGLTHGAIYRRFPTKAALTAEVIAQDFDKIVRQLAGLEAQKDGLATYVGTYLGPDHRDFFPRGCPAAPLAAEVARVEPEVQQSFCAGLRRNIEGIAALDKTADREKAAAHAMVTLATLVGALSLARACKSSDLDLSDAFLQHAKDWLLREGDQTA